MVWARLYNKVVADFSPDKKKRKEATKADANYEEAIHRYGDGIGNLFWGIIKISLKYNTKAKEKLLPLKQELMQQYLWLHLCQSSMLEKFYHPL